MFWFGVSASALFAGLMSLAAAYGYRELSLYVTLQQTIVLAFAIAAWGLVYYLFFVFTRRPALFVPITLVYLCYYLIQIYTIAAGNPVGVDTTTWRPQLVYATPVDIPFFTLLAPLLIFVPTVVGAIAYLTLLRRVRDPSVRYRIVLVAASLLAFSLSVLFISRPLVFTDDTLQIVSRVVIVGSSLTILLAYYPPASIRNRFGIEPIATAAPSAGLDPVAARGTAEPSRAESEQSGPWAPSDGALL